MCYISQMMRVQDVTDHLVQAIQTGERRPGDKLPPHRQLAWKLGCSVTTVTRAYNELERQGFVRGEVGRGTFVLEAAGDPEKSMAMFPPETLQEGIDHDVDFTLNFMHHRSGPKLMHDALTRQARRFETPSYQSYFDAHATRRDREIGAQWLSHYIGPVDAEDILISPGAQAAIYATIVAFAGTSKAVAAEEYCYPGFRAAIEAAGARAVSIDMDHHGIIPEAFEQACQRHQLKVLVTMPTCQNPTGVTQPTDRRQQIAEIAIRHNVTIVEDGIYDFLYTDLLPSYRTLAPDNSVYVMSLTKVANPAMRVGYLTASKPLIGALNHALTGMVWMTSELIIDLANDLITSGRLQTYTQELRAEALWRQARTVATLGAHMKVDIEQAPGPRTHYWLKLPEDQKAATFVSAAQRRGVKVLPASTFCLTRIGNDNIIRICTMAPLDRAEFERGLAVITDLFEPSKTAVSLQF